MKTIMTTQQVVDLAKRINEIDGRVSAYAEGGMVCGCFRGKGRENYKFNVATKSFVFNNEGPTVQAAVEAAVLDIMK